jgi:hypothetical protein
MHGSLKMLSRVRNLLGLMKISLERIEDNGLAWTFARPALRRRSFQGATPIT